MYAITGRFCKNRQAAGLTGDPKSAWVTSALRPSGSDSREQAQCNSDPSDRLPLKTAARQAEPG
jgi:hypothetical protein